jgi:hypothetical protein
MIKFGSAFVDWRKAVKASSYQNECKAATPLRKYCSASPDPEVGKSIFPNFVVGEVSANVKTGANAKNTMKARIEILGNDMGNSPSFYLDLAKPKQELKVFYCIQEYYNTSLSIEASISTTTSHPNPKPWKNTNAC